MTFNSITEALTINFRKEENKNYIENDPDLNKVAKSIAFPSCFSISQNDQLDRYVTDTSSCANIREQVFFNLWSETDKKINVSVP